MSPIQHSDRENVTYFWLVSCSTLLMLISSISHAPRLIHSNSSRIIDIVAFAWTVLPVSGVFLNIMSKIGWRFLGYSVTASLRVFLSNTLLVTIALSLQYMTCIDQGYYGNPDSFDYPSASRIMYIDVPGLHCHMIESPSLILIAVFLTIVILATLSLLTGKLFGDSYKFFQYTYRRHISQDPILGRPPAMLPMVPWFSLGLTSTAIQLLVTLKMFVGRLDIRHILNALCREEADCVVFDLRQSGGEWFDFFADGGDGFNSTYGVARIMAQPNLKVAVTKTVRQKCALLSGSNSPMNPEDIAVPAEPVVGKPIGKSVSRTSIRSFPAPSSMVIKRHTTSPDGSFGNTADDMISPLRGDSVTLPRPQIVVHGGDLAYPRPSAETYKNRFIQPLEAALPFHKSNSSSSRKSVGPQMFIIPGNHDWYDGLEAFVHWIIGRGNVGGWRLPQKSSYFCLQLVGGWWVMGVDIALSNDLDVFQYQSLLKILKEQVEPEDRVVVVSHRPQWISDPYDNKVTGELYHQLLEKIGPKRLRMRLAGDLHNYSRFSAPTNPCCPQQPHLVTSGGAGAFLHPTHVPDETIVFEYFEDRRKERKVRPFEDFDGEEDEEDDGDSIEEELDASDDNSNDEPLIVPSLPAPFGEKLDESAGRPSVFSTLVRAVTNLKIPQSLSKSKQKEFYRYRRASTYPSAETSRRLTWMNPLHFRDRNWGADIILGTIYVSVGVSVLPICSNALYVVDIIHESPTFFSAVLNGFLALILNVVLPAIQTVWTASWYSLLAQVCFWAFCFSTCKSRNLIHRIGIATVHWFVHVFAAITIFASIEVGIEFLARLSEGRDSVLADGFRVPGLVSASDQALFNAPVFESLLGQFLRFIDLPSSLIRNRKLLCEEPGVALARQFMFRYLWRVLPFFWLIATPIAAFLTGCYLLVSLNWFGLHMNEAFSSLRIEDYKHFMRMHIEPVSGDLHCYVIGIDKVPKQWEEDPAWDPTLFATVGQTVPASSRWVTPSKWRPRGSNHSDPSLVDYFIVRR